MQGDLQFFFRFQLVVLVIPCVKQGNCCLRTKYEQKIHSYLSKGNIGPVKGIEQHIGKHGGNRTADTLHNTCRQTDHDKCGGHFPNLSQHQEVIPKGFSCWDLVFFLFFSLLSHGWSPRFPFQHSFQPAYGTSGHICRFSSSVPCAYPIL